MIKKKSITDTSNDNKKPVDQISVLQIDSLKDLSPRFKNEIVFDLVSTHLERSKYATEDFYSQANAAKSFIEGLAPESGTQLILAGQIASMHKAHQSMLMHVANEQRIDQMQMFINLAIKISNTINQQIALMDKLKAGNQQKVVIEHVSINGGQAVVGTINTTPTPKEN